MMVLKEDSREVERERGGPAVGLERVMCPVRDGELLKS